MSTKYALYNGQGGDGVYAIGAATSSDGKTWTRYVSNPILVKGAGGAWDDEHVKDPYVIWDGSQFVMYFAGYDGSKYQIGRATASVMTGPWTKYASNPVLAVGAGGSFDANGVAFPTVLYEPDDTGREWKMWYRGEKADGKLRTGYAYSTNGLAWTKVGQKLDIGSGGTWNDEGHTPGAIVKSGLTYYLYTQGRQGTVIPRWQGGLTTFTDPEGTYTDDPGNPILLARFNDANTTLALSGTTAASATVDITGTTSGMHVGEDVIIADGNSASENHRIAAIPTSTRITLDVATTNTYTTGQGAVIRSFAYNSVIFRRVVAAPGGGYWGYGSVFQALDGLSTGDADGGLREGAYRWTAPALTGPWSYDYDYGLLFPLFPTVNGTWDDISAENPQFFDPTVDVSTPGVGVDWDGGGPVFERVKEWLITRGASAELTGGSQPGSATITLINTPDDRYNPENTGGDLYGFLHDGPRVWIGINEDGTIAFDAGKDVYGLHAGRITEVSVEPEAGATVAPFVTIVTADPFEWASRQNVTLADSRTRSQADLRLEVLDALGWTTRTLPAEPATLPLSSADGLALRILDDLNSANGTRHFAKPEDTAAGWFRYVAVRRTSGLDGSSSASLDAGSDHFTDTNGWRISADGVINQQKASVEPLWFSPLRDVWEAETPLPTVVTGTPYEVWVEFPDFVDDPVVDVASTGGTLTATLVPFGRTAKLTLTSSTTNIVTRLAIQGHIVVRGSVASVVIDDTTSQADPRGVRAGPELTGDYLGTLTSAEGFARHIVYRFAGPLYRPTVTVVNWFPQQFDLDLFDRISVTVAQLSITDRIFEIVGLTHHGEMAGASAILHTTTYVLQECREQTDPGWFILDDSLLDGTDVLAY